MDGQNNTNTLLSGDINRIRNEHDTSRNAVSFSAILHLDKKDIELRDLIFVDIDRFFNTELADTIQLQGYLFTGDYQRDVVPELDNLNVTITRQYGPDFETSERYKLIVLNHSTAELGTTTENQSKDSLNKGSMKLIIAQAINITYYATRLLTNTKALRGANVEQAMVFGFNDFVNNPRNIRINGTPLKINKINIDPPHNQNVLNNITIKSSLSVYDIPSELQDKYGVYNGDIGTYICREFENNKYVENFYVYPLYNPSHIKNRKRKMRLYATQGLISKAVDRTFVNSENNLDILVSAEEMSNQIFNQFSADRGAGVSVLDSNAVTKAEPLNGSKKVNSDQDSLSYRETFEKSDGVNFNRSTGQTSNVFKHRSAVLRERGTTVVVNWNFSIPEFVYPGMTVQYIYEKIVDDMPEVKTINGTVLSMSSRTDNNKRTCHSTIFIFLEPEQN